MLQRMKELVTQLRQADTAYYKHDHPIMTDREYDTLYDELLGLEKSSGIILSGSPTQKVSGEVLDELEKVTHSKPMLSAAKTKSPDEIVRFVGKRAAVVSWKLDGLTLVLRYDNGKFRQAITRGMEGLVGEDVTHTVRVMMNVPLTIPCTEPFEVRGEGVVSWSNFEKINEDTEDEPYTHPRGLAAGSVRRLDARKSKEQFSEFIAFELVSGSAQSKLEQFQILNENGFDTVHHLYLEESSDEERIKAVLNFFDPQNCAYPVDGLIVEYDDIAYGQSLGATGHHENRLMALKWKDTLYETKFLGLELATTRTGMVSITGKFEDVEIDGTTVNRAYLHNLDILDSFKLGIGDTVRIYKANQIIPQLADNLTKSGTLRLPAACPCCESDLAIRASTNGTRFLYCENPSCPAKLIQKFVHFCSKTRMNIEGLSEKTLKKLIDAGLLKNLGDLYELKMHAIPMAQISGFGPKLTERLLAAIEKSRCCTLNYVIAGLGIHTVGRSAGRIISDFFEGDWDRFEQAIRDGFDFTQLQDFGQTMHDNLYAWYADKETEKFWRSLLKYIQFQQRKQEENIMSANNPFSGKTVVATGKLQNYTRDGIQMKLLSLSAKPASAVSKNTDYLIVGEVAGGKLAKARQLGVATLTEAEFEAMLADAGTEEYA